MRARSPRATARRASRDRLGSQCLLGLGAEGEDAVEVEGVGDVDVCFDVQGAGEVDVVLVHRHVAGIDREVAVLRVGGRVGLGEVEALDGLRDQSVELRGADLPGDGRDLGVDPPGGLRSQRRCGVDGGLGHQACAPRSHRTGLHLRPQPRQPVAQLEGVADELLRRHRGDAEDGAELGDAELRHQRAALAGDGLLVLTPGHGEARRQWIDSGGWRSAQLAARARTSAAARSSAALRALIEREQGGGAEVVVDLCSHSWPCFSCLDHVF